MSFRESGERKKVLDEHYIKASIAMENRSNAVTRICDDNLVCGSRWQRDGSGRIYECFCFFDGLNAVLVIQFSSVMRIR